MSYKYKLIVIENSPTQDTIMKYILDEAEKVPMLEKRIIELEKQERDDLK
jgi:hypothetical protein